MHLDVLTPERQELLGQLPSFDGFYLAGGTALALQLGHRQSVDFDLFSDQPIWAGLLTQVEATLAPVTIQPLVNTVDELTVLVADTKLTFLHYPFPVLEPFVHLAGLRGLGVPELAATKAYTIGRRGSLKDYVDLYTIVSGDYADLQQIISLAEQKYGDTFNGRLFLEQLVWLEDLEDEPIVFLGEPIDRAAIRSFFEQQVRRYSAELLTD